MERAKASASLYQSSKNRSSINPFASNSLRYFFAQKIKINKQAGLSAAPPGPGSGFRLPPTPVSERPPEKRSGPPLCPSGPPPDPLSPEVPATKAPQTRERLRQNGSQMTSNLRNRRSQVRILSGALSEGGRFRSTLRSPAAPGRTAPFGRNRRSCPQAE
jgi:hypothetical protein